MNVLRIFRGLHSQASVGMPSFRRHSPFCQPFAYFADPSTQVVERSQEVTGNEAAQQSELFLDGQGRALSQMFKESFATQIEGLTNRLPSNNRPVARENRESDTHEAAMGLGCKPLPSVEESNAARFIFCKSPTRTSDEYCRFTVNSDGKAFTLALRSLLADTERPPSAIATRSFHCILPCEDGQNGGEIEFHLKGFVATKERSTATVLFCVNGQSTVLNFPAYTSRSFLETIRLHERTTTECRVAVFLLAGKALQDADSAAFVNVATIDGKIGSEAV